MRMSEGPRLPWAPRLSRSSRTQRLSLVGDSSFFALLNIYHWHHSPVCKKTAKSGCAGKHCDVHTDKTHMMGKECASCKNAREVEERSQQHDGTKGGQGAIPYITPRHEPGYICAGKLFGIGDKI